jgi:hypothetical protein
VDVHIAKLREAIRYGESQFGDGMLSFGIYDANTGLEIIAHNPRPQAGAAFSDLITTMNTKFAQADILPPIGDYYLVRLAEGRLAVVLCFSAVLQGLLLVDVSLVSIGAVVSMVIPRLLELGRQAIA